MAVKADGFGIASLAIGIVFVWGGAKGYSPLKAAENIINGRNPKENQTSASLVSSSDSASCSNSGGGAVQSPYTQSQLATLWTANGGDPAKAKTAACIAWHE